MKQRRVGWRHIYCWWLLLTNGIQEQQHWWKKCVAHKLKVNVTLSNTINLWTFYPNLVYIYLLWHKVGCIWLSLGINLSIYSSLFMSLSLFLRFSYASMLLFAKFCSFVGQSWMYDAPNVIYLSIYLSISVCSFSLSPSPSFSLTFTYMYIYICMLLFTKFY